MTEEKWHEKQANKGRIAKWIGIKLDEFNWGMFVVQKFFWIMNLAILVKVYGISWYVQVVCVPLIIFSTWLLGRGIATSGVKKNFIKNYYKGSNIEIKSKDV